MGYVAMTLQLLSFLGVSSVEHIIYQRHLVFVLWSGWKNLLPTSRKVKKKNQIPEYHALSPKGYNEEDMRLIDEKNLLTQWDTEEENRKIYKMWLVKKPPNL